MKSGRQQFQRHKFIIDLACKLFSCLPVTAANFLWSLSTVFVGQVALLIRYAYCRSQSRSAGRNVYLGRFVVIKAISQASFGDNVSIHDSCYLDASGGIQIGNNVSIAHQSSLISFNHTWNDKTIAIKYNPTRLDRIVIEDDVWIGCGVRIMPGVHIGSRSVVAAGAVVISNVPSGVLVGGIPARVLKRTA